MDFAEIKSRYLEWPMAGRMLFCLFVGAAPGAIKYFLDFQDTNLQLESALMSESQARSQFEMAKQAQADLQRLQAQLAGMEDQLDRVKRYLPDSLAFDEVLHTTAEIAKEQAVTMTLFEPKDERRPNSTLKFVEQPIDVHVRGSYGDIAVFYDRLLHLERVTNIRNLRIRSNESDTGGVRNASVSGFGDERLNPNVQVEARGTMIVFRGLKANEAQSKSTAAAEPLPNEGGAGG